MGKSSRAVSLRWSLLRSFLLLVLLTSLTMLAVMQYRAWQSEQTLSLELTQRGLDLSGRALERFLEPARTGASLTAEWGRLGLLDLAPVVAAPAGEVGDHQHDAITRLNRLFLPILKARPSIDAVSLGNDRGEGWLLLRRAEGGFVNRIVARDAWGPRALWFDTNWDGYPANPRWVDLDYDPRTRPWYVEPGKDDTGSGIGALNWTHPYNFTTTRELGITSSRAWRQDGTSTVVAWDVLLSSLSEFTQGEESKVSDRSLTVVYDDRLQAIGLPEDARYRDPERMRADLLKPLAELDHPLLHAALRAASRQTPPKAGEVLPAFSFEAGGETWWAATQRHPLPPDGALRVAVLVPSNDLVGEIAKLRVVLLGTTLVAVAAALLLALFLTRAYSRPLEALAAQSRRIRELDFSLGESIEANVREVRDLAEAQAQSLAAVESFSRYVPVEVVRELVAEGDVARIGGQSREMTLLFSDIADFTRISEGLDPQALADHMADYFDALIHTIQANDGTVDKLVGDAIVAFWGAPHPDDGHAEHAVAAALACRERLVELNATWREADRPPLVTRFGLASGTVIVGNFGAPDRLAYTVLGDKVNLASRLEGLNKVYGSDVLAAEATVTACGDAFAWRRLDRVVVKGHQNPTWIYELLGARDAVPGAQVKRARAYEAAWDRYADRQFGAALEGLDALLAEGADTAAQRLRARCAALAARDPGEGWEAVYRPDSK